MPALNKCRGFLSWRFFDSSKKFSFSYGVPLFFFLPHVIVKRLTPEFLPIFPKGIPDEILESQLYIVALQCYLKNVSLSSIHTHSSVALFFSLSLFSLALSLSCTDAPPRQKNWFPSTKDCFSVSKDAEIEKLKRTLAQGNELSYSGEKDFGATAREIELGQGVV